MLFRVVIAILALVSLLSPSASQGDDITLPLTLPARVISANQQAVCLPDEVRETARNDTTQEIRNSILNTILPTLCIVGQTQDNPSASCSEIPTSCSSGYYWVRSSNGTAVQVYCDTQRVCGCSNTTGWTCIASLNTSDPSQQCLGDWVLQTYSSDTKEAVWKGQQWWGMSLSSVQHSWDQLQSCVWESDRVSRHISGCICTTRSTDH